MNSISFVIPLFNNDRTLVNELHTCISILKKRVSQFEVIVCNDGSTDQSGTLLSKHFKNTPHVRFLNHKENLGIAPTLRHLYREAKLDYIFLYSIDGDWNPQDIYHMLTTLEKSRADIVIGVRSQTNYTHYRKIVSFLYNYLPHILFGIKTHDAGSIKIIKKSLINTIPLSSKGVFFEAEIILKAAKRGYHIALCHNIHYRKRIPRAGRGAALKNVVLSFKDMIHLWLTGL